MKTVAVIMSTYNGEYFLEEQLQSIFVQKNVILALYVRDDGSRDQTVTILKKYEEQGKLTLIEGRNIGVGNSFMDALYQVPPKYDFYAFSDQDDIWNENKLDVAIKQIENIEGPSLYVSNQWLVDKDNHDIGMRYNESPEFSYKQILCRNYLCGCTMVFNNKLFLLLAEKNRRPSKLLLRQRIHDMWVPLVASVTGEILYDKNSYIHYRQHQNNVVGVKKEGYLKRINTRWKKIKNPDLRNGRSLTAKEVFTLYEDLLGEKKTWIYMCAFYRENLSLRIKLLCACNEITKYTGESRIGFITKVLLSLF